MKYRLWLSLSSLIIFLCVEALLLFGYGCLSDQKAWLVLSDFRFLLVAGLVFLFFIVWIFNVFLGMRRVSQNPKKRFWKYLRLNWLLSVISIFMIPIALLSGYSYDQYLQYPGKRAYEKALFKGYGTALENGMDTLNRHGVWEGNVIVAHALGGFNGETYTLCEESLWFNYERGFRVFEIDLVETLDGDLAIQHFWPKKKNGDYIVPTTQDYKMGKINGKYTPLLFTDILQFMKEHPDVWMIPDFKTDLTGNLFQSLVLEAQAMNAVDVLERIIPQIFSVEMYRTVNDIYEFSSYVYGSYVYWNGSADTFEDLCRACVENHIDSISMWNYYCTEEVVRIANRYNIDVYVHSENNSKEAMRFLDMGVKGIYTDFVDPSELEAYR
ncbi:MAG: hypothetical protein Q4C49_14335 [Bacillota bacterium]|nr:hypothetical protein [Bacillota bacterium]